MSPGTPLLIGFVAFIGLIFLARWIYIRVAEWRLREPIGKALDDLMRQVMYPEVTPLQDVIVHHMGANPGVDDPNDTSTHYEIRPARGHYFAISHIGAGEKRWYRVNRWREDVYGPTFPPLGGQCRSEWFVERMKRLCRMLDAYPRDKLLARIAERARGVDPEPGPDLLPAA